MRAAHSNAGILRFAATDSVRQFTRLFESQPDRVYSHCPAPLGLVHLLCECW